MMNEILNHLHFLRPLWFYAFIPLALYLLWMIKKDGHSENWQKICDARLLPFVLTTRQGKRSYLPVLLTFIATSLCITALAGPVYKKLPQQVFREQSALVILLDLSQSMNAADIKPSRIERAKLELLDILKQRHGGQTALIVYAANAFTVTPLTDDNGTIANLVPVLITSMMPAQGSNLSAALARAHNLFIQAGVTQGDVLIITDGIHKRDLNAIKKISAQGYRVSIFGIGTTAGAPIPLANGFLQNARGAIVIPKLNITRLRAMAHAGSGLYTSITADSSDTQRLTTLFANHTSKVMDQEKIATNIHADSWQDEGVWLVLPLLFFAALWVRKGWIAIFIIFLLPFPQSGFAAEKTIKTPVIAATKSSPPSLSLQNLWLTPNQKAMRAFNEGNTAKAAKTFTNPKWKASALYRNGNYKQAAKLFNQALTNSKQKDNNKIVSSNNFYNEGNALAKAGRYKESIAAYKEAIKLNKSNTDAVYNRNMVIKALKKQQQKNRPKNKKNKSGKNQQKQNKNNKNQHQNSGKQGQKKEQSQKNKQQNNRRNQQQSSGKKQGNKNQQSKAMQQGKQSQAQQQKNQQKQSNKLTQQQSEQQKTQQQNKASKPRQSNTENSKKKQQKQQALKQAEARQGKKPAQNKKQPKPVGEPKPRQASLTEDQKATEQWLRRIPDDPGGLLRRKFLYQYSQLPNQHNSDQPW